MQSKEKETKSVEEQLLSLQRLLKKRIVVSFLVDGKGSIDFLSCYDGRKYLDEPDDNEGDDAELDLSTLKDTVRVSSFAREYIG